LVLAASLGLCAGPDCRCVYAWSRAGPTFNADMSVGMIRSIRRNRPQTARRSEERRLLCYGDRMPYWHLVLYALNADPYWIRVRVGVILTRQHYFGNKYFQFDVRVKKRLIDPPVPLASTWCFRCFKTKDVKFC
jgi:hypothetical protein